jgi:hypothetical protein
MQRLIALWALCCLAVCGLSQATGTKALTPPPFTVSNRITSTTTIPTLVNQIKAGTRRMIGAVVTDDGCDPEDPEAAAAWCESLGLNSIDFQHVEIARRRGWITIPGVVRFADRLKAHGIFFSVGLADKLGEDYVNGTRAGVRAFGEDLFRGVEKAEELYRENIQAMLPLLQHPGCFKVNLANEPRDFCTPELAIAFHNKWIPVIRKINPNLQITNLADAWQDPNNPARWDAAVAQLDAQEMNFYGTQEDFNHPSGGPNWIVEAWGYRTLLWARDRLRGLKPGMPVYIGEYGSYDVNPAQGSNEMFLTVQAATERWHTSMFALVTNRAGWVGKSVDKYAAVTSKLRMNLLLFAAYLNKNLTGLKVAFWDFVNVGPRFYAIGDKCEITERVARVNNYIWTWDRGMQPVWLVRGF